MKNIYVVCEGKSEVLFVKDVLNLYFGNQDTVLIPVPLGSDNGKKGGGNVKPERILTDVHRHLSKPHYYCTTFFDFYGLPSDFPGKSESKKAGTVVGKSQIICDAIQDSFHKHIGDKINRFIPYVQMYEFEGLLFSDVQKFAEKMALTPKITDELQKIRDSFDTPEHINDSQHTAPSKRILKLIKGYQKPVNGLTIAKAIGLSTMRRECPIFNQWLTDLEQLPSLT